MKYKNYLFLIFLFFISTSLMRIKKQDETGFSKICTFLSDEFINQEDHDLVYNYKTKKYLHLNEFSIILKEISKYDLDKNGNYKLEKSKIGKIEKTIWSNKKYNPAKFEKLIFETEIATEYNNKIYSNKIIITDYKITRINKPYKIYLRLINKDFESLIIDKTVYSPVFESQILGTDESEEELEQIINSRK
jgi:hypothetical protein